MFTGKEISLGRPVDLKQNSNDFETNNRNAKAAKVDYDEMLHHVATHLGFRHTTDGPSIENLNAGAATGGMTLTAPLKKQEKVEMRANGKKAHADGTPGYDNIKDHVRGSVVVRHRADLPHVMDALRKHMGDKFEIAAKPKDRYAEPTQEGYSDVSLALRHKPTGHIGELQLSTFDMIHAKEHGEPGKETPEHAGHHYYDVTEKIKDKEDKGEATPQELGKRDDTNAQARHLYSGALESESKQEPALEKHPAARFEHGHAIARSYAAVQAQGPLMDRSGRKYNKPFGGKLPV